MVLAGGSLANNAQLSFRDGEWQIQGDPTEAAFLVAARKLEGTVDRARQFERHAEVPFTSKRKMMSVLVSGQGKRGRCGGGQGRTRRSAAALHRRAGGRARATARL